MNRLSCSEVSGLIDALVDGDLNGESAARVQLHLDACDVCRGDHGQAVRLKATLNAMPAVRCPDRVMDAVLGAVAGAREPARVRRFRFAAPVGLAAAAAVAVGLSLWMLRPETAVSPEPPRMVAEEYSAQEYSAEEIALAEAQVKSTLAYIGRINLRSAETVQGHLATLEMIEPARDALTELLLNSTNSKGSSQES